MRPTEAELVELRAVMVKLGDAFLEAQTAFFKAIKAYRDARTALFEQRIGAVTPTDAKEVG